MIVGTPEYMAPEQCENRPIDARTDVYALGVMAYQMLAGVLPFTGSITQLLLAHVRETPRPARSVNGLLPPALDDALLRALRKRPEDRFPDMASFAAALAVRPGRRRVPREGLPARRRPPRHPPRPAGRRAPGPLLHGRRAHAGRRLPRVRAAAARSLLARGRVGAGGELPVGAGPGRGGAGRPARPRPAPGAWRPGSPSSSSPPRPTRGPRWSGSPAERPQPSVPSPPTRRRQR